MKRRSFSGKKESSPSEDERKDNINSALGLSKRRNSTKYVVTSGDTLDTIAEKLFKDPDYWILLALKNDLPDTVDDDGYPTIQLRRGASLRLPDNYELDSFSRNPDAPVVVALATYDDGLVLPLGRDCGFCGRETLAMATDCVACGENMDSYEYDSNAEDEVEEDDAADDDEDYDEPLGKPDNSQKEHAVFAKEHTTMIPAHDSLFPAQNQRFPQQNQSPQNQLSPPQNQSPQNHFPQPSQSQPDPQSTTILPPQNRISPPQDQMFPPIDQRPPHKQDETVVGDLRPPTQDLTNERYPNQEAQPPFAPAQRYNQSAGSAFIPAGKQADGDDHDSFWNANTVPEYLDKSTRIVEASVDGDVSGLVIALQVQSQGEWITVYEYVVFSDQVNIVQHQKKAGTRRMKKSLPARQTRKMAWNHFRGNWQIICSEYWAL